MNDKIKASSIKPMWRPKTAPVDSQCEGCPFKKDRGVLKGDESGDYEQVIHNVELGLDFHCHETVYANCGTKLATMLPQAQWRTCIGAVKYRQRYEVEKRKEFFRQQGRLIEDA